MLRAALEDTARASAPTRRYDFESETFVVRAEHDGSPGPDTGFDVIAFHNRQDPDESGEVTHPLGAKDNGMAIAFSSKDHGADASEDVSPTLRASVHGESHENGGAPPAVAYSLMPMNSGKDFKARKTEVAQPVMGGGSHRGDQGGDYITQPMAFAENSRHELREMETAGNITSGGGKPGQGYPAVRTGMQVRRLTVKECARLQGFPDEYLDIAYRGKPAADGPRYRALGNSMAVPCMAWIGRQIQAVSA